VPSAKPSARMSLPSLAPIGKMGNECAAGPFQITSDKEQRVKMERPRKGTLEYAHNSVEAGTD
jgi:hypothetical protein